ncbi:Gfo/Idh/MocA family protein [Saccharophagus degradans]|uniref:Gfo/Idh/MocA family oxidoreductase n=1 Tax=Saccharophagus degradans TaxID=86304 RepID=A0AAW7XBC9_9GAMM|nr:Gfo/Idh/MocA family oxidoreductase [Saccharophagus degradans]MDO6424216.1 Gfo/Idh/MocA family oxidoreductase [Saccharophagus degradans]MDO6608263.1 Gfo/Idh/MocA family oxidoreductase [Saccharophagus degradans]
MSKVRMGLVGGGPGAFIGDVHRMAARIDGEIELVCGAFSSQPEKSTEAGRALYLPTSRVYESYIKMFEAEAKLPAEERMEFVAIVTPNHLHYPIAIAALEAGFHVMCEKPATFTLQESLLLKATIEKTSLLFGVTHTYTGYPIVHEARERVARGDLGKITKVLVEYNQGWLADSEAEASKQASWRIDPKQAGISCCMGDIGVHAANLAETITGSNITRVLADLAAVVPGRQLDDDGSVLLRFENGARGVLVASQISVGEENNLTIRVYGTKGGLEWHQMNPNTLTLKWADKPAETVRAGWGYLGNTAQHNTRTPAGHPEGYLEAFANLYTNFSVAVKQARTNKGSGITPIEGVPGIEDAINGMAFIQAVVTSSADGNVWLDIDKVIANAQQ